MHFYIVPIIKLLKMVTLWDRFKVQIENVNEYPNTFFNTLIIYSTMGNFRLPQPQLTHIHVYKQLMCMLLRGISPF